MSDSKLIAKNTLMLYSRQILTMVVSLYTVRVVLETLGALYKLYKLKGNHFSFIYECVKNGVTMNTVLGTLQFYIFLFLNIKNNKD